MSLPELILVVDDESMVRFYLRQMLEGLGYRVLEAGDGAQALQICDREHPDMVLLDLRMPGMGGLEACPLIQERDIPVIILSGTMDTEEKVKAFKAGAKDFVTKPFQFEEVHARVQVHLELRSQKAQLRANNEQLREALKESALLNRKLIELNEKLRESEALKGDFLSNMRNEINNPLGAILGLAKEISAMPGAPEAWPLAALITAEASQLDFQVRNIFCAADLEAGDAGLCPGLVDVPSLVLDVVDSFAGEIRAKALQVEVEPLAPELRARTDADKLRIIVANLVSNAIKFSAQGGLIRLRAGRGEQALVLEVADHGPGIAQAERSEIFSPFKQLVSGPCRPHPGQGLGLAVAAAVLDLLGGSIQVDSPPEGGARFVCLIPDQPEDDTGDVSAVYGNTFFFDDKA